MRFARPRQGWLMTVIGAAVAALFLCGAAAEAAKPGSGVVPPGTIYFNQVFQSGTPDYYQETWRMSGDGSGKAFVAVLSRDFNAVPSHLTYDGHRWWLVVRSDEAGLPNLWATPDGVAWVQVTDSRTTDNGDGTDTISRFGAASTNDIEPSWSNDGLDSFASIAGVRWTRVIETGEILHQERAIFRVAISGVELETILDENLADPKLNADDSRVAAIVTTPFLFGRNFVYHHWSPDGAKVAYAFRNDLETLTWEDVWVADVSQGPADALLDGFRIHDGDNPVYGIQWSGHPSSADQRIVFSLGGAIRSVQPDGAGAILLAGGRNPHWSPDGQYVAFDYTQRKGTNVYHHVGRIPAAGGTVVNLTSDLDKTTPKSVRGWHE
ncbi:MAG: hypothetical protein KY475_24775 [Planctomycetes bacterium]|nr:hypothetical protein [Planctomycetota bacterium]